MSMNKKKYEVLRPNIMWRHKLLKIQHDTLIQHLNRFSIAGQVTAHKGYHLQH